MVICVVALLVVGPEKLPEVARTLGRTLNQFKNALDDLKRDVALPTVNDIRRELISVPNRTIPAEQPPLAPPEGAIEHQLRTNLQGTCEEYKLLQEEAEKARLALAGTETIGASVATASPAPPPVGAASESAPATTKQDD
jgi:TatA/E family protein of Tat protein translocase